MLNVIKPFLTDEMEKEAKKHSKLKVGSKKPRKKRSTKAEMTAKEKENKKSEQVFRRKVSRLADKANKRIARLEKNGLQNSPAYKALIKYDWEPKFGIRGKDHNKVRQELARIETFLDHKTSTVRGIKKTLVEMAKNTKIKYTDLKDLQSKQEQFFELASKVSERLEQLGYGASIGYSPVWEAINEQVEITSFKLEDGSNDLDLMVIAITDEVEKEDLRQGKNRYDPDFF